MSSDSQSHPWHMVEPSPWPALGALGAFVTALGGIWFLRDGPIFGFLAGLAIILFAMWGWWRDVINEGEKKGLHTPPVAHGLRMGMVLFIASEVMFFFAFFWAYFNSSVPFLSPAANSQWPPEGIEPLHTWSLPFFNTLILLSSGLTVSVAHSVLREAGPEKAAKWMFLTAALGALFVSLQAYEYGQAAFSITDGIYPSTFYLATGFHGFHVLVGTIFLFVCFFRAKSGHFKPDHHVGFEAAAWYWHFVDVVWLFLFIWVYWWGSYGYKWPAG